jgi:hypothetical protein
MPEKRATRKLDFGHICDLMPKSRDYKEKSFTNIGYPFENACRGTNFFSVYRP